MSTRTAMAIAAAPRRALQLVRGPATGSVLAHTYRARDAAVRRALAGADLVAIGGCSIVFAGPAPGELAWTAAALPGWMLVLHAYRLYDDDIRRFNRGVMCDAPRVVHAALIGSILFWLYARVTPLPSAGVEGLLAFAAATAAAMLALRVAARRVVNAALGPERVVIVGDSVSIPVLARKLQGHREYRVEVAGAIERPGVLDLAAMAGRDRIDRVVIAGPDAIPEALADVVRRAHRYGLKVDYLPQPLDVVGAGAQVDDIEGVTVIGLYPPVLSRSSRAVKRAMDIAGAFVLLVAVAPLMLAIAALVKADSRGPVLFRHERVGRSGRRFRIAKFRTMVNGAEAMAEGLRGGSRDPHWLLLDRDPRVTRAGRLLRLSSLDELPQLWNVLKGDMSLVGPRPLVPSEDDRVTGWARGRLDLTPGLTGLWQVLGRTSLPFEEMVKLDYVYVTNWSAGRDLQLLLRTIPILLSRRGAN
jgi:exopolysaccharide biosynthesis polyprenyl glycosylphosphotransferase